MMINYQVPIIINFPPRIFIVNEVCVFCTVGINLLRSF